jgi:hypothetical protein
LGQTISALGYYPTPRHMDHVNSDRARHLKQMES